MLTEVVDRGQKLYSVDGSLWTVNGSSLACYPSPLSESQNQFWWSSETHVERNKVFIWFNKNNNLKSSFRTSENTIWFEKQKCSQLTALHLVRKFHLFNRYVFKSADWDQNCSFEMICFQRSGVYTHWFFHMCLILLLAYYRKNRRIFIGKSEELLSWLAICLIFWWFYLSSVW